MATTVTVYYQLLFQEDAFGAYDRETYRQGDLFQNDRGKVKFDDKEMKGFYTQRSVTNTVGHGVTDCYPFPESFEVRRTIEQITKTSEESIIDPQLLGSELNM